MAITGPISYKNVDLPNAHIQLHSYSVTPGFEISGAARIYADSIQAQNIENSLGHVIVITVDDQVTDHRTQLYHELLHDDRFQHMNHTPELNNINTAGMIRRHMRQPVGHVDSASNTITRFA